MSTGEAVALDLDKMGDQLRARARKSHLERSGEYCAPRHRDAQIERRRMFSRSDKIADSHQRVLSN